MRDVLTGDDQGARDPGRARAREQLQPRRPRPRRAGQGRLHRGGRAACSGCTRDEIINAVSHAWVDGQSLRTYRHAPNTGSRKSWAAGDATSRAVRLALIAKTGEMGYPSVLTRQDLGLLRRAVQGQRVQVPAPLRQLRDGARAVQDLASRRVPRADRGRVRDAAASAWSRTASRTSRRSPSARTRRRSASSTRRARSTTPPTATTASSTWSRCRCIFGRLTAADYEDDVAADPRIDALRDKIDLRRGQAVHADYHDPEKRSIANALTVEFKDGTKLAGGRGRVPDRPQAPAQGRHAGAGGEVQDQPRAPLPGEAAAGDPRRSAWISQRLEQTPVNEFVDLFVI